MPRLINDPTFIVAWIRHGESKISCMTDKPLESRGALEVLGEWRASRSRQINSPACVVFAETRWGANAENACNNFACSEFARENLFLILQAPESRYQQQSHSVTPGRGHQTVPMDCCPRNQSLLPVVNVRAD